MIKIKFNKNHNNPKAFFKSIYLLYSRIIISKFIYKIGSTGMILKQVGMCLKEINNNNNRRYHLHPKKHKLV